MLFGYFALVSSSKVFKLDTVFPRVTYAFRSIKLQGDDQPFIELFADPTNFVKGEFADLCDELYDSKSSIFPELYGIIEEHVARIPVDRLLEALNVLGYPSDRKYYVAYRVRLRQAVAHTLIDQIDMLIEEQLRWFIQWISSRLGEFSVRLSAKIKYLRNKRTLRVITNACKHLDNNIQPFCDAYF
jgi:hypothetical protein